METVKAILGVTAVLGAVALVVYLGFINPSMRMDVDASYVWTKNCADETEGLTVNSEASESLAKGLGFGRVIVIERNGQNALIFITESEDQAKRAESELRGAITERAPDAFTPAELSARIIRRARSLLVFGGDQRATPPPGFVAAIGQCVYEVSKNRWTALIGLDTQEIRRPFRSAR